MKVVFATVEDLEAAGRYWQRQLRLEDWNVQYSLRMCGAMPAGDHAEGSNITRILLKEAEVCLRRYDNHVYQDAYDMEQTLVHELLHLHFEPFFEHDEKSLKHVAQEQAIDQLASAFVRINRGDRR